MLEFNQWFFVLVANFLLLLVVLNILLFKPLASILTQRDESIKSTLDQAKSIVSKKDDAVTKMNAELAAARNKSKEAFEVLREEGLAKQREILAAAEAKSTEIIEKSRTELRSEAERARAALRSEVDRFSEEIINKLVKV